MQGAYPPKTCAPDLAGNARHANVAAYVPKTQRLHRSLSPGGLIFRTHLAKGVPRAQSSGRSLAEVRRPLAVAEPGDRGAGSRATRYEQCWTARSATPPAR